MTLHVIVVHAVASDKFLTTSICKERWHGSYMHLFFFGDFAQLRKNIKAERRFLDVATWFVNINSVNLVMSVCIMD